MTNFAIFNTALTCIRLPSYSCSSSPLHFLGSFHLSADLTRAVKARDWGSNGRRGAKFEKVRVVSSHSNPKILKSNRRSRYGQSLSTYDTEEEEEEEEEEDDDDGAGDGTDDDWFLDDDSSEDADLEADRRQKRLQKVSTMRKGRHSDSRGMGVRQLNSWKSVGIRPEMTVKRSGTNRLEKKNIRGNVGLLAGGNCEKEAIDSAKDRYCRLSEELDLDEGWIPLLDYLSTFGLKESHFIQMYERHMPSLQINVFSAQERLEYLLGVGVKHRDIKKIIMRQPQILGYTVESNLKSHVAFLHSLGIPDSKIGQIIAATPSLFSYSVENSLKPTIRYLLEEVGIKKNDLIKVVQLSPQILVQRIDTSWNARLKFLTKELGAPRENIVKMVTKHPQLLHYSIEDGLLPRIEFLRSIGLKNADILKVLTSLTQVLSLSLEGNLKPKYRYLINELRNEVHSLTKYPTYLSLSLDQRIRPRHRFLVSLKKAPKGPFPLSSLVPTDESFCQQWAGTSVDKYLDFRQRLLLKEFAQKYER